MRFFLHVENGVRATLDTEGEEFSSGKAAVVAAAKLAGDILGEESAMAPDQLALRVLVDGPDGAPVATVRAELTRGGAGR